MMKKNTKKPELLAPAGSSEALDAAIAGGADAVYFGASAFNARMNAANFDRDAIRRAIEKCRNYGVRSNITFNTLIYEKEFSAALDEVAFLYEAGADALIVADLGLALEIRRCFPELELHASTQMSIHNTPGAVLLAEHGFSRAVLARELDRDMIKSVCASSPIESEIFVHGALCVSHSGQCLFSSLVGGRSGNRGECAQPCRLPYSGSYPLSLKDNCLAASMSELLKLGAASFKIEGRMKSPSYVYGVSSIYRRLIDEGRDANDKELCKLASLFSRSGFTDGYFKRHITREMNGIRTEKDIAATVKDIEFDIRTRRRELCANASIKAGEPCKLTFTLDGISACALGDIPYKAINAPLSSEAVKKNLLKLGSTDFNCKELTLELDDGLILPISKLNEIRRSAVAELEKKLLPQRAAACAPEYTDDSVATLDYHAPYRSASFLSCESICDAAVEYFDMIYLPLDKYDERANGVILPPVIFDREIDTVARLLDEAARRGAKHALVGNLGHIRLALEHGYECHGDLRLNATNPKSVRALLSLGLCDVIPSPELTLARLASLDERASGHAVIYGRLPLMLLEKCVIKQTDGCEACKAGRAKLVDRTGESFPIFRLGEHRNVLYNSRPTYMADRKDELYAAHILGGHFIFTDEGSGQVEDIIEAYKNGRACNGTFRRIAKR